jgi:HEAT repeat protein
MLLASRYAIVRAHAAWALGQLGDVAALEAALATETDPEVRAELTAAVSRTPDPRPTSPPR